MAEGKVWRCQVFLRRFWLFGGTYASGRGGAGSGVAPYEWWD